tara:strand:- start:9074 stop:9301 length:228 start_codon:yes stop_codon:yes gene_type:complete
MALKEVLVNALIGKYEAQIAEAKANISVFLENGVGVAEHAGTVETIDGEVAKLAEAEDKLQAVKRFGPIIPPKVV